MNIQVKVDTSQLDKMLADFPATLAVAQQSALLSIGAEIKSQAERAFRHPNYRPSPWAPRKEEYQRVVNKRTGKAKFKRKDTWPLLIKSGKLRQSIAFKLEGKDAVVVGSDAKYAPYHQFGTKHMPARPFFPLDKSGDLTPRVKQKIIRIAERTMAEEFRMTLGKL